MSTTDYKRYINHTMRLARSLTIKSAATAARQNAYLKALGLTVDSDPRTWKYYQNLAGIYHPLDQPMWVTSLDTKQQIVLNQANLATHYATRRYYQQGTRYHQDLIERFPQQELLIRGILNPVPIDTAIEADDFTILAWDAGAVESNETNLIDELQQRIKEFAIRWHNPNYTLVEDLYTPANLAVLYSQIPGWLLAIRLGNCHTRFAHSFHIGQYLASHGQLDRYIGYLTKGQQLFLYRNIKAIQNQAGQQATFDWLIEKLFTDRQIGMAEYTLRHNTEDLVEQGRPAIIFDRQPINAYHQSRRTNEHTLDQLLAKQRFLTPGNARVEAETRAEDLPKMQYSRANEFPTKVVESALVDRSESGVVIQSRWMLSYWAYWSSVGRYVAQIQINHPRDGSRVSLPADQAFLLFAFCINKAYGVTLETIGNFGANNIKRNPTPSRETLIDLVDRNYVSDALIDDAASQKDEHGVMVSITDFVDQARAELTRYRRNTWVYGQQSHYLTRGYAQMIYDHLYGTIQTQFTQAGKAYPVWLRENGLNFGDLTILEYHNAATALMEQATGLYREQSASAGAIQQAMVEIMRQLSSYHVQFIREFNEGPILVAYWSRIRLGDTWAHGTGRVQYTTRKTLIRSVDQSAGALIRLHLKSQARLAARVQPQYRINIHRPRRLKMAKAQTVSFRMQIPRSAMDLVSATTT